MLQSSQLTVASTLPQWEQNVGFGSGLIRGGGWLWPMGSVPCLNILIVATCAGGVREEFGRSAAGVCGRSARESAVPVWCRVDVSAVGVSAWESLLMAQPSEIGDEGMTRSKVIKVLSVRFYSPVGSVFCRRNPDISDRGKKGEEGNVVGEVRDEFISARLETNKKRENGQVCSRAEVTLAAVLW